MTEPRAPIAVALDLPDLASATEVAAQVNDWLPF